MLMDALFLCKQRWFDMKKSFEIREHAQSVYDVTHNGAGSVFTCSGDGFVVAWDLLLAKQSGFVVKTSVPAYSLSSSDQMLFVGLSNGDLHWVDLYSKQEIRFFTQHKSAIFRLVYDATSQRLLSTDADGFVGIWNVYSGKLEIFFQLPSGKIRAAAFSNDSNQLALGGQDGMIYIFETNYFNETHRFFAHQEGVSSLAYHPQKNVLVSGGKDAYLRSWDCDTWLKEKAFPAHLFAIYDIVFSLNKQLFATCSRDKSIKIWNANNFEIVEKLDRKNEGHQHSVNALLWNENGLISVSDDRRVILWNN